MKLKTFLTLFCGACILLAPTSKAETPAASPNPTPSAADSAKAGHHRAGKNFKRILKSLDLTKDQRTQVKAILKTARPQIKALRENVTLSKADKHSQIKAIRSATLAQVRTILTPQQQTELDAMLAKSGRHGKKG